MGRLIDSYLSGKDNSEDDVIHLLFAANRLEKRCQHRIINSIVVEYQADFAIVRNGHSFQTR